MSESVRAEVRREGGKAVLHPRSGGLWAITLTRRVAGVDRGRLWDWITQPELLGEWSPFVPDRPLTHVGRAHAREVDGARVVASDVLQLHAGETLRHRWGPDDLTWRIEDDHGQFRLTLEDQVRDRAEAAAMAASWDICLAVLACRLRGEDVPRVLGEDAVAYGWQLLHDVYTESWEQPDND